MGVERCNKTPEKTSEAISSCRFMLCVMVVFIHSIIDAKDADGVSVWVITIMHYISQVLCTIAVPGFMMFSSYLLFFKYKNSVDIKGQYISNLKKKFKGLLIPYVIWNLVALIWLFGRSVLKGDGSIYIPNIIETFTYVPKDGSFGLYPADGPLWFIRDLIILNILAPIIYSILKFKPKIWLFLILAAMVVFKMPELLTFHRSVPPFLLGATLGIIGCDISSTLKRMYGGGILLMAASSFVGYIVIKEFEWGFSYIVYNIFVTSSLFALFILPWYIQKKNIETLQQLSKYSFFVYAAHIMIVGYIGLILRIMLLKILPLDYAFIITYFLSPCLTIAICIGLDVTMRRCAPRLHSVITGSRI